MAKKNFLGNSRNSSNGLRIVLNPLFEFRGGNRNYFDRYRSDYFIRIVFNNLKEKKVLNIIKYNKNIKNRININIGDYKKYSENYSSIEIGIKPINNKYGKFINIKDEDKLYYHIYFNDKKEEIKRNYINYNEEIKKIIIIINYQIKSFNNLFLNNDILEQIYIKKYNKNIINMVGMFYGCTSLKKIIFL